ncbi:deoxyribodipyrimidine photo-lyase [Anaerotalea alkaliphila]|uniref:Deoxyribodipyrimidine photo-lyase n=1 Tax=Anaerotalea alkaliphila TaxID=2662126 RepID=A0A7X5KNG1_9FIRM|nr:deoxyribodipyrimidine photo-lyase [Anaerotalea alkaliphila]NDL68839.1 deoxyribodipyrimidine photolyase [Anaerotalea alkaliphila]
MEGRLRILKEGGGGRGPVVHWTSRDLRTQDHWGLSLALEEAERAGRPLVVCFVLHRNFLGAAARQYDHLEKTLRILERELGRLSIPFRLVSEGDGEWVRFLRELDPWALYMEASPLRKHRDFQEEALKALDCPVRLVDARNVVPVWEASDHQEYGAYTLRPKWWRKAPLFRELPPPLHAPTVPAPPAPDNDWGLFGRLLVNREIPPVEGIPVESDRILEEMERFLLEDLPDYGRLGNDPVRDCVSRMSPHIHFGRVAPARLYRMVEELAPEGESRDAYLEQLLVRRELGENFCWYRPDYDRTTVFPAWARETLEVHRPDVREHLYSPEEFERAATHDPLWNASMEQLRREGRIHGYMRMYWAKKILEWSPGPEEALATAIRLNDTWALDGRDPVGYANIAWSVGGVHDRAWAQRPVFGKVRYMNDRGCRRKFDVEVYIGRTSGQTGPHLL